MRSPLLVGFLRRFWSGNGYRWAAYAAIIWSVLFATQSFYAAAGGTLGAHTFGPAVAGPVLERQPGWVAALWVIGLAKLVAGLLVAMLIHQKIPLVHGGRRLLIWAVRLLAILFILYGGANLIQHVLMSLEVIAIPSGLGETALRWHLGLWDWWWLGGGVLFFTAGHPLPWSHS